MRRIRVVVGIFCVLATMCAPALVSAADVIFIHGHIYTGNAKALWAQALAVTGTKIEAVATQKSWRRSRPPRR